MYEIMDEMFTAGEISAKRVRAVPRGGRANRAAGGAVETSKAQILQRLDSIEQLLMAST